jgi:hypothetical protein
LARLERRLAEKGAATAPGVVERAGRHGNTAHHWLAACSTATDTA